MLKKTITFTDYDGNEKSVNAYFNLTKTECIDLNLEFEEDGGLVGRLKKLMSEKVNGEVAKKPAIEFVKMLIDRSYGVRPADDPTAFIKEDDDGNKLIKKFKRTLAYDTYVFGLLSGDESLDEFAQHVLPDVSPAQRDEAKKMLEAEGLSIPDGV